MPQKSYELFVDESGGLKLPDNLIAELSLAPGTAVTLESHSRGLLLNRSDPLLRKVYVEPTNACNLACQTCVRHCWDEPESFMDINIFKSLVESLRFVKHLKEISFWGIGEPLFHPDIVEMVGLAKGLGVKTSMITNARLLDENMAIDLIRAGLDSITVSVDGTTVQTNDRIRAGGKINDVVQNVEQLRFLREREEKFSPEIGLEFVLMRQNVGELKNLRRLAGRLGASFIVITNLLPYVSELKDEIMYNFSLKGTGPNRRSEWQPEVMLPVVDIYPEVAEGLAALLGCSSIVNLPSFQDYPRSRFCKFVEEGSAAICSDGRVAPCIALMHSYDCFIAGRKKHFERAELGNIETQDIRDIWLSSRFVELRRSVKAFDFSPCSQCGGCELGETNREDCFGNLYPVCGDCLWAQSIIQCP